MKPIFEYIIDKSTKVINQSFKNDKMYDFIKIFPDKEIEDNKLILDTFDKFSLFNHNCSFFIDLFISLHKKGCKFNYDDTHNCQKLIIEEYANKERGNYYKAHYLRYLMYNKISESMILNFYDTYIKFIFIDTTGKSYGLTDDYKLTSEQSAIINYYNLNQTNMEKFENLIYNLYNR